MRGHRILLGAALVGLILAGACGSEDSLTAPRHGTITIPAAVPPPGCGHLTRSGTYAVGRRQVTVVDPSRPTAADPSRGMAAAPQRTIEVTALYPAMLSVGDPGSFTDGAAFAAGRYPVVIYSHAVSSDGKGVNDQLARWVRSGYVVLAPTFPLSSREGGQVSDLPNQPGDVMFVDSELRRPGSPLAEVARHSATDCLALAGHSLGALTTVAATMDPCCRPPGQKAAIVIAGGPYMPTRGADADSAPAVPMLLVHGEDDQMVPYGNSLELWTGRGSRPTWLLTFPGGSHLNLFQPPREDVLADSVVGFLDAQLRGDRSGLSRMRAAATDGARLDEPARH